MGTLASFLEYAEDFEKTYDDDDWSRLERHFAPDAVYVQHFGQHGGEYVGHDGIRAWLEELHRIWSQTTGTVENARDVGDDVRADFHLRVDSTTLDVEGHFAGQLQASFAPDGRISRLEIWQAGADW